MIGYTCEEAVVKCATAPCRTIARCMAPTNSTTSGTTCAAMSCPIGQTCEEALVKCIKPPCPSFASCFPIDNSTALGGCANVTCPTGEYCEQATINCFAAPCPVAVSCVPFNPHSNSSATTGCAVVRCRSDEVCEEKTVNCLKAPCPVQVSCVSIIIKNNTATTSWPTGGPDPMPNTTHSCNMNETWSQCTNPCSEAKCETNIAVRCKEMCSPGCACNNGFKRNTTGYCVLPANCNTSTGPVKLLTTTTTTAKPSSNSGCARNETATDCYNKCSEKKCPGVKTNSFCTKHCQKGCGCQDGFLRSSDGKCYKWEDCPEEHECGQNEEWRCTGCDGSCKKPDPKCETKDCKKSCQCAIGFIRLDGKCVTLNKCPSHTHGKVTCLATEEYTDCMPQCVASCTGTQQCDNSISTKMCKAGCVCRNKYKMDSNGECVHNRLCFKTTDCPENEEWTKCQENELSCNSVKGLTTRAPTHDSCFSGCICSEGFARNSNGTCVVSSKC